MFEKSAPWQHVFVKVADVAPINVLGGPTGETRMEFLEEVVVLRRRVIRYGEMEVSVPDSFDVLRLDGTCASLAEDEFMSHRPAVRPKYAPVVWQQIDGAMREVLEQNERVEQAREGQYHACRGSFLGGGGVECREATQKLARAIMTVLGQGVTLPAPNDCPSGRRARPCGPRPRHRTRIESVAASPGLPGASRLVGGRLVAPVLRSSPGPKGASRDRARSRQIVKRHLTVRSEQTLAHGAGRPGAPASDHPATCHVTPGRGGHTGV